MKTTITKEVWTNRRTGRDVTVYVVRGEVLFFAKRRAPMPVENAHRTMTDAAIDAEKLDKLNATTLENRAEHDDLRREIAREYLAKRAARPVQLKLF